MTNSRSLFACVTVAMISFAASGRDAIAGDYVWARTAWGSGNADRHYSSMTNGYGGYYVPRNEYGNNYEARGGFTNPHGYIIPAQTASAPQYTQQQQTTGFLGHRRHSRRR